MAFLLKMFGTEKVMRFFPPVVTGPMVIAIGLTLSGSAINNCQQNWLLAITAIAIVIGTSIWGKGIIKIVPILLGVLGSYILAALVGIFLNAILPDQLGMKVKSFNGKDKSHKKEE